MGKRILRSRTGLLLLVTVIAVAAMAVSASLVTTNANALPTFTNAVNGIGPCDSCHTMTTTHPTPTHHVGFTCDKCHVNGDTSVPPTPAKCAACHGGPSAILASTQHVANKCGTTPGCHGVPSAEVTPAITIKSAASVKVKKPIKISGQVTPTSLAGSSLKITIQKKSGAKWKTVKSASATVSIAGAYVYKYKPTKKGAYHVKSAIAAKAGVNTAASSPWKSFKVK